MSNKKTAPTTQVSALPEIDPADMDAVSGGCANCAQGAQTQQQSGASKLAAMIPMLANQAGR